MNKLLFFYNIFMARFKLHKEGKKAEQKTIVSFLLCLFIFVMIPPAHRLRQLVSLHEVKRIYRLLIMLQFEEYVGSFDGIILCGLSHISEYITLSDVFVFHYLKLL